MNRRKDMYHCEDCGTCCEMFDHHCGVFGVCICKANFKYFILFICHGGLSLIILAASIDCMISNCTNKIIEEILTNLYEGYVFAGIITGISYIGISICLLCASLPMCDSDRVNTFDETHHAHQRLKFYHKYKTGSLNISDEKISMPKIYLKYYFGSSWNFIWWLIPF